MTPGRRRGLGTRDLPGDGRRLAAVAVATLLAAGTLAGCGGSSGASASTRSGSANSAHHRRHVGALKVAADPSGRLRYRPSVLRTRSHDVAIHVVNHSGVFHNFTLATSRGVVLGATPTFNGGTRTLTVKLKPGRYTFYCSVPGHRAAGMHGTLIVR